jgi:hypothetical protein
MHIYQRLDPLYEERKLVSKKFLVAYLGSGVLLCSDRFGIYLQFITSSLNPGS